MSQPESHVDRRIASGRGSRFSTPTRNAALYGDATRAAFVGLLINAALGVAKLAGGRWGDSFALLTDALNSAGDVVTSLAILASLRFAQRPADAEHPYGHVRFESIAAMQIAALVFLSALGIGWEAVNRIGSPQPIPPFWTLLLAGANAAIKETLYQYKIRVSRRTGSAMIRANAWDHRADALCSLAVLAGLALVRMGGPGWRDADECAALFVVVAILASSGRLFTESVRELMDLQADDQLVAQVRKETLAEPGVRGVEKLWLRKAGLEYFADLHLEVDPNETVLDAHRLGHRVKDRLLASFPAIRDVLVHLEPHAYDKPNPD